MFTTLYVLSFSLFGIGVLLYIKFALMLSKDMTEGHIPVRIEDKIR